LPGGLNGERYGSFSLPNNVVWYLKSAVFYTGLT